jgi:hypothetical protein
LRLAAKQKRVHSRLVFYDDLVLLFLEFPIVVAILKTTNAGITGTRARTSLRVIGGETPQNDRHGV